jgi:hypothetical protein
MDLLPFECVVFGPVHWLSARFAIPMLHRDRG